MTEQELTPLCEEETPKLNLHEIRDIINGRKEYKKEYEKAMWVKPEESNKPNDSFEPSKCYNPIDEYGFNSDALFIPKDLLNFIYGDNPDKRIYFGTDFNSVVELINYMNIDVHKEYLSRPYLTIEDKMTYLFGDDWNDGNKWFRTGKIAPMCDKPAMIAIDTSKCSEPENKDNGTLLSTPEEEKYEMVNHPTHYNSSSVETIEKMRRIWGNEATALWCEMTAFKYRDRIGNKPDNPIEQEVGKIQWYEKKAKELRNI